MLTPFKSPRVRLLAVTLMCLLIVLLTGGAGPARAQSDSFVLKGRQLEVITSGPEAAIASRASGPGAAKTITLRDQVSGQVRVYASGLVLKLRQPDQLQGLLRENPALKLQLAPGGHAYVSVEAGQLPAVVRRLSQDDRVVDIQLRALQPPLSPR